MTINLDNIPTLIAIISFFCVAVRYFIIMPQTEKMESFKELMNRSIEDLSESIKSLTSLIKEYDKESRRRTSEMVAMRKDIQHLSDRLDKHEEENLKG